MLLRPIQILIYRQTGREFYMICRGIPIRYIRNVARHTVSVAHRSDELFTQQWRI